VLDSADAMFRAAIEACRQHERVGRLLEKSGSDAELLAVAKLCDLCQQHLAARKDEYETAAAAGQGKLDDAPWHGANALWHASRDYARRHQSCDAVTAKLSNHSLEKFGELHLEYELEASSVLALRQAIAAYKKLRPEAE
jgi:hypothetical protein